MLSNKPRGPGWTSRSLTSKGKKVNKLWQKLFDQHYVKFKN